MLKPTHERFGILTPLLIMLFGYYYFDERITLLNAILLLIFSFLGSTFPDIDQRDSTSGRRFFLLSICFAFWRFVARKLKLKNVERMFGHRGITHSLIIPLVLYCIYFLLNDAFHFYYSINYMVNGFFIGIATHLLLDMFNPSGIPIFAPFSYIRINIAKIKTGSDKEIFFRRILTLTCIVIALYVLIYKSDKVYEYINILTNPETYENWIKDFWNWLGSLDKFEIKGIEVEPQQIENIKMSEPIEAGRTTIQRFSDTVQILPDK